jgi:DNA mismatch repair protein MutS
VRGRTELRPRAGALLFLKNHPAFTIPLGRLYFNFDLIAGFGYFFTPEMSAEKELTPMMAQYRRIKGELPKDALLLFRLGDFYEMFFEDAQTGSQLLNVALTKRGIVPMCGIPFHAANNYISRILRAGRKVAICDQVEEARPGQLVKREVTQILSPGTHFDDRMLAAERNNFLATVYSTGGVFGLALVDLTTGSFRCCELPDATALVTELERVRPAEVVLPAESISLQSLLKGSFKSLSLYEDWVFAPETAQFTLRDHFKVASLDGFGLKGRNAAIGAAGGALHYLHQNLRRDVAHLVSLSCYQTSDFMSLDGITLRHLEILEPMHRDSARNSTLYGAMNRTVTPMGARRLRDWLSQPLSDAATIKARQDAVETWFKDGASLETFRKQLAEVRDLERTIGRLSSGTGNARDLNALRNALAQIPALKISLRTIANGGSPGSDAHSEASPLFEEDTADFPGETAPNNSTGAEFPLLASLETALADLPELVQVITGAITEEPPMALKEGGMIRDGFDAALDELRTASRGGKDWIAKLQQDEIESTGIASLKVRFNSVFGYYIEITRSNLDKVPPHYIRKQTIANGERYITPELKEMEGKILGAEERSVKLEYELFLKIRETVIGHLNSILGTASALAQLDVLACFAETARLHGYTRPFVGSEGVLQLRDGRHPVLEQHLTEERFVPNDADLGAAMQIALITGPNMAGKSTYIRQVALLALLAHTGSFLPATEARVDLIDRIFTRIGASDDLSRGQSTFMVEMSETANILNNATARSLVILDEIGRGTSTFDGLSLAWAIVEHLHNQAGAKTLFATHYHELTELAGKLPRIKNFNVAVREWNDQIVFLRKIVEGGTDKSYGIQVARLAGVPKSVVERAKQILQNLEESELTPEGTVRQQSRHRAEREKLQRLAPPPQMDLFGG